MLFAKMTVSFSINAKSQPNRLKTPSDSAPASPPINCVSEFRSDEPPPSPESKIKPIAPIPNPRRPNKKLKSLPPISQPNGEDAAAQFEFDPAYTSTGYGLNLRKPSAAATGNAPRCDYETFSEMESRILREDLVNLPHGPGLDEFEDVPVEGFGAALLTGYGWEEGRGIGRNSKEDVRIYETTRKSDRGGIGFTDHHSKEKTKKDAEGFIEEKEVVIVKGRGMGMKGKLLEVRNGGELLVVRMSKSNEKVKVRSRDFAEVGSAREEKCMRKLKELRDKESDKSVGNLERVDWLRNHIRVRIVGQELKGGALFLKKGVVMDVVGPGVCDICVDESGELVQGVDQDLL